MKLANIVLVALQRNTFVRCLIFSFAVLFALLRSTQYFHAQPLLFSGNSSHQVAKYQAIGQQLIFTRHMEQAVEERFTSACIPAIQFNGIISCCSVLYILFFNLKH